MARLWWIGGRVSRMKRINRTHYEEIRGSLRKALSLMTWYPQFKQVKVERLVNRALVEWRAVRTADRLTAQERHEMSFYE